jgi:hypothetical protein
MVDLPHHVMRLVERVNKRQAHMARLHLKLIQDGIAKSLSGDASAIGDEEDGAVGHWRNLEYFEVVYLLAFMGTQT